MKELGTIIATPEGPSTQEMAFVITAEGVRRGQYVCCENELGTTVALVTDVVRANRYFERPESVSAYEKGSRSIFKELPTGEWEYVIALCRVLGAWGDAGFRRATYPPSPGVKVRAAENEMLKKFLGLDGKGLEVGVVVQHELPARINLTRMLHKHIGLLGLSGSGKSNAASVLIEELLDRKPEDGRLAVVVFDVHGEYACFGDKRRNPDYAEKTTVINAKQQLQIAFHKIRPGMLQELSPEMSATQVRELAVIVQAMKKTMEEGQKAYGIKDVMLAVKNSPLKENVKGPLLAWLGELKAMRLFGRVDYPPVKEFLKPGRLLVIDLSQVLGQKKKQVIVSYLAKKLFAMRQQEKIPPFLMLVEEAHNFAREKAAKGSAISKHVIETIAREGRKFGASLCLVSQRPVQLSTTALSQLNSFLIFRITNPYDIEHIKQSCEAIDEDIGGQITTLGVGEGILFGEATNRPVFIQVRERRTQKGMHGMPLEELAKRFEQHAAREITPEDVEAFV